MKLTNYFLGLVFFRERERENTFPICYRFDELRDFDTIPGLDGYVHKS